MFAVRSASDPHRFICDTHKDMYSAQLQHVPSYIPKIFALRKFAERAQRNWVNTHAFDNDPLEVVTVSMIFTNSVWDD